MQIGEATNRRYLDALAEVKPTAAAVARLDSLCRPRVQLGQHFARFSPVSRSDSQLFQAILSGSHLINGLSNRDLQNQLWTTPPADTKQARSRCRRVSRSSANSAGTLSSPRSLDADDTASPSSADASWPPPYATEGETSLMLARLEDSPHCGHSGGVNH